MSTTSIIKQNLLYEPLSADALRLARGIYNTYLDSEEEPVMEIKITNFYKLLHLEPCKEFMGKIQDLLEELNEPLAVRNFEFRGERVQLKFVQFCAYKITDESITIEISPEYLHVQREYMLDSFLF